MDYTYGEELPLDVVAPLFASAARASSSNLPQPAGSSQPASRSTSKISTQVKDMQDEEEEEDDLEEGELLEDGEISEETSDEAEFIAASLIATAPSAKQAKARDTLHTLPQDWIHRLEPQSTSTTALSETGCRLPEVFHPSKTGSSAATHQSTFIDLSYFSTA